uniref:DOC domain-containing protein n=1 Tax=Aegilops tauschii subsp. strangulata TaxID=200361 RepID=A0A453A0D8_AEGTS
KGCPELSVEGDMREMAKTAAWSVSSCKPGNGVASLRDDSLDTYWQSDGAQPHLVNIQFQKKVQLQVSRRAAAAASARFGLDGWRVIFFFLLNLLFGGIQLVVLYVDFKLDESYTPSKISIRAGDGFHNLKVTPSAPRYIVSTMFRGF